MTRRSDAAPIGAMRDVVGRIADLIHRFDAADLVLQQALTDALGRDELGLGAVPCRSRRGRTWMTMTDTVDLFGHQPAQASLFGDAPGRMPDPPSPSYLPDPEDIRRRLRAALETARAAERMPREPRKARMWQTIFPPIFPQMANWLPEEEADRLRFAFAQEIERLKLAV